VIFLTILKNIKFDLYLDIYTKIILYGWIDYLNFESEKSIHNTEAIHAMYRI
jgi:hypothetical protein